MQEVETRRRSVRRTLVAPVDREARRFAETRVGDSLHRPAPEPVIRKTTPTRESRRQSDRDQRGRAISMLLIGDNRLLRMGLSTMMRKQVGLKLVASASQRPPMQHSCEPCPDAILIDADLGDRARLQVAREVRAKYPDAKLIVMGLIPMESGIVELVREGVSGFVLKDASFKDFITSVRAVVAGRKVLPAALTDSLLSQIVEEVATKDCSRATEAKLTAREQEVAELIADGLSNKEIGQRLSIATDTVKSHVHNILEKLSLRSRVDVAVWSRIRVPATT